jgi:hypothetical protein
MWDPPDERPSLEPTAAELAWKRWLMQALVAKTEQAANRPPADRSIQEVKPAA